MGMTVGELQAELAKIDPQLDLRIAVDGTFTPVIGVTAVAGAPFAVVRGVGKGQTTKKVSILEEGVIGRLTQVGLNDEEIAQVIGRPTDSVERKRKALGFRRAGEP